MRTRLLIFAIVAMLTEIGAAAETPTPPSGPAATPAARSPAARSIASVPGDRARIDALIRDLRSRRITLTEQADGWWAMQPRKDEGFTLRVNFRVYPLTASEDEMRRELSQINLAYLLNVQARLAMSYPSARGPLPAGTRLEDVAGRRELMQAFQSYRVAGDDR